MVRLAARSVRNNLRRYVAILVSVVVSVAFVSGSLVLSDSLTALFRSVIGGANSANDVVVRSPHSLGALGGETREPIDVGLIERLAGVEGVAAVTPIVFGTGQIVGSDGEPLGGSGAPTVLTNWIDDPPLNAMRVSEGRAPQAATEVVIDEEAMERGDLEVGDRVTVLTPDPVEFRIVGRGEAANSAGSVGGATVVKAPLATAQRLVYGAEPVGAGLAAELDLRAEPGLSETELQRRVEEALSSVDADLETITAEEQTEEILSQLDSDFLGFLRLTLLAFAAVATVAAGMTIANCFAIVATQRSAEMALLRALGASRRQLFASVALEAVLLGGIASVLGLFAGLGLAKGLGTLLSGGLDLPSIGVELTTGTVVLALGVGVVVTLLASLVPIVRMSRTAPVAALRSGASEPPRLGRRRGVIGGAALAVGATIFAVSAGADVPLPLIGLAALMVLVGVMALTPFAVRLLVGLTAGFRSGSGASFARRSLGYSPRRASAATSSLIVGVAIVSLMTVFASSLVTSVDRAVAGGIKADLVVTAESGQLSDAMLEALRALPELQTVTEYRSTSGEVFGSAQMIGLGDPQAIPEVLSVDGPGTTPWPSAIGLDEVVVSTVMATEHNLRVGSTVPIRFLDGTRSMRVVAIHSSSQFLGDYVVSDRLEIPAGATDEFVAIVANAAEGVPVDVAAQAANEAIEPLFGPTVFTGREYADHVGGQINNVLGMVYGLLALTVFVGLVGIGTSMSLSVSERVGELRLLHAIGMNRGRLRSMVRWESAMVAVLGTTAGIVAGVIIGVALMASINRAQGFGVVVIPGPALAIILGVGAVAGVLASLRPSARAARATLAG